MIIYNGIKRIIIGIAILLGLIGVVILFENFKSGVIYFFILYCAYQFIIWVLDGFFGIDNSNISKNSVEKDKDDIATEENNKEIHETFDTFMKETVGENYKDDINKPYTEEEEKRLRIASYWMTTPLKPAVMHMFQQMMNITNRLPDLIPESFPELEILEDRKHDFVKQKYTELCVDENKYAYQGYKHRENAFEFYIIQSDFDETLDSSKKKYSVEENALGYKVMRNVENNISFFLVYNGELIIYHELFWALREVNLEIPLAPSLIVDSGIDGSFTTFEVSEDIIEKIINLVRTIVEIQKK